MGRARRIEQENLFYHVFNRGIEKRDIFFNDDDREFFLDVFFEAAEMFNVETHSFTLMPNHFHLFIKTLEPNLCRFMHGFMNKYVKDYNRMNQRVGRLFQGPYKAIVVDSNNYGHVLSRYIHLNCVRGHGREKVSVKKRLKRLNEFPWSSYRVFADLETPRWPVKTGEILADFGDSENEQHKQYAQYVKEGMLKETNPFADVVANSILGDEGFVRSIKDLLKKSKHHDASAAHLSLRFLSPEIGEVIDAVEGEFGVRSELFLAARPARGGNCAKIRDARRVFLWAAAKACSGRYSLKAIGAHAGDISPSGIAAARDRIDKQKKSYAVLAGKCKAVLARLDLDESALPADSWARLFKRLTDYKSRFGHCLVPKDFPPDPQLGKWVAAQRLICAKNHASKDPHVRRRINQLNELGVSWKNIEVKVEWEKMFQLLKAFNLLFGHTNVPNQWEQNPKLAAWAAVQRDAFNRRNLEPDRQKRLESLGFIFQTDADKHKDKGKNGNKIENENSLRKN